MERPLRDGTDALAAEPGGVDSATARSHGTPLSAEAAVETAMTQLRAHEAFARLDERTLRSVASASIARTLSPGETFVEEGDVSRDLFLILSGTAVAVRRDDNGSEIALNTIEPGDCVGELAFVSGETRHASVRAETTCHVLLISADALDALPDHLSVLRDLTGALASVAVRRTRQMSDAMLVTLQEQLAIKTLQNQFGYFLVLTISLFIVSFALFYLVAEQYVVNVYDPGFTWQTVFLLAIPCLAIIRLMKIPARDLGIKREGVWRSLGQSAVICAALTAPVAIYIAMSGSPAAAENSGATITPLFLLQYFVHSAIQEVGARGLLQNLFQKFLSDSRGHKSVLLTSTIFSSLHITFGIDAVLVTLVASILFGYVFLWQKNLAGVVLLHFWLGTLAAVLVAF